MKERFANNLVVSLGLHLGIVAIFAFAALFASRESVPFGSQNFVMVDVAGDSENGPVASLPAAGAAQARRDAPQAKRISATKHEASNLALGENQIAGTAISESSGTGSGSASGNGSFGGSPNGNPILAKIRTKIERAKFYPAEARGQNLSGKPKVEFEILPTGEIKAAKIISSSGSAILDKAALETIHRAGPLPYFPEPIKLAIIFDSAN